jgi:hypothetical protein
VLLLAREEPLRDWAAGRWGGLHGRGGERSDLEEGRGGGVQIAPGAAGGLLDDEDPGVEGEGRPCAGRSYGRRRSRSARRGWP